MKALLFLISVLCICNANAASKTLDKIHYIYQLDVDKSFDFSAGSVSHECGSTLYRTTVATDDIAARKFSMVLAAYMAGKKVTLNTEGCSGSRMKFGWIRIHD